MTSDSGARHGRRAILTSGLLIVGGVAASAALPKALHRATHKSTAHKKAAHDDDVGKGDGARTVSAPVPAMAKAPGQTRPPLFARAMDALDTHGRRIARRDRIAIADFAAPSAQKRFHIVDLGNGRTRTFLVAHGMGSDPDHSGWVKRFSNRDGSNASSEGAFLTGDYYSGAHGRSQRLIGLDPTNDNALPRGIVVHGAWYVGPDIVASHGMLGRSQGCFAVAQDELRHVFDVLGPGRMLYAAKI